MSPSLPPAALMVASSASSTPSSGDWRASPVAALARIRARSDAEPVLWWWQGDVFGKRPGEIARRLLRISGVGFNRIRHAVGQARRRKQRNTDARGVRITREGNHRQQVLRFHRHALQCQASRSAAILPREPRR